MEDKLVKSKFQKVNENAVFRVPEYKKFSELDGTPGPGWYNDKARHASSNVAHTSAAKSVFKSSSSKMMENLTPAVHNPPPGHYEFEKNNLLKRSKTTFNLFRNTSSFCLPSNCKRVKVNLYDPFKRP